MSLVHGELFSSSFSKKTVFSYRHHIQGGAKIAASTAITELDDLIATVTNYLKSQSLWVRREGRWDSDEM